MLAPLRVAAAVCTPAVAAAARRGRGVARSGRESRSVGRTGKQRIGGRRGHDAVAFGVQRDGPDRGPVAGPSAPAAWIGLARLLVQGVAGGEDGGGPRSEERRGGKGVDLGGCRII